MIFLQYTFNSILICCFQLILIPYCFNFNLFKMNKTQDHVETIKEKYHQKSNIKYPIT